MLTIPVTFSGGVMGQHNAASAPSIDCRTAEYLHSMETASCWTVNSDSSLGSEGNSVDRHSWKVMLLGYGVVQTQHGVLGSAEYHTLH